MTNMSWESFMDEVENFGYPDDRLDAPYTGAEEWHSFLATMPNIFDIAEILPDDPTEQQMNEAQQSLEVAYEALSRNQIYAHLPPAERLEILYDFLIYMADEVRLI